MSLSDHRRLVKIRIRRSLRRAEDQYLMSNSIFVGPAYHQSLRVSAQRCMLLSNQHGRRVSFAIFRLATTIPQSPRHGTTSFISVLTNENNEDKTMDKWQLSDEAGVRIDRKVSALLSYSAPIMLVPPLGCLKPRPLLKRLR
jgi:hypothetical protein